MHKYTYKELGNCKSKRKKNFVSVSLTQKLLLEHQSFVFLEVKVLIKLS